jgi:hypothetical protein
VSICSPTKQLLITPTMPKDKHHRPMILQQLDESHAFNRLFCVTGNNFYRQKRSLPSRHIRYDISNLSNSIVLP